MVASRSVVFRTRRAVLPGGVRPASVALRDGVIEAVIEEDAAGGGRATPQPDVPGADIVDLGDLALLPGLVDTHVHVNEPGRTEWEGFRAATRAAAAGGITAIVDMPLNSTPVTTTVAALRAKQECARAASLVDYGFWGGVVPGCAAEIGPLLDAGVLGFKCFLCPSGIEDFPHIGPADLLEAMSEIAARSSRLLAHAEDPETLDAARTRHGAHAVPSSRRYADWLASRPALAEVRAVGELLRLVEATGCRLHVVHVSAADALTPIVRARAAGLPVTCETCPHYLAFAAESIPDGATLFKCAPPIRGDANRERLWEALAGGAIDLIASDHSPCPPAMRRLQEGDFFAAWGGIASLQLALPAVWTHASARGFGLTDVVRWMSAAPARLAAIDHRKGAIRAGGDADFVVFDPDARFVAEAGMLYHRHPQSPWVGMALRGRVVRTYVRGTLVFDGGSFPAAPAGRPLEQSA